MFLLFLNNLNTIRKLELIIKNKKNSYCNKHDIPNLLGYLLVMDGSDQNRPKDFFNRDGLLKF